MAQTIKLKRSATQNAVPSTSSLALGEIALNTYDGKLFIKKDVGGTESIVTIGAVGAGSIGPSELASTAVTAGSYGSTSAIPVITVDADGRITSASTATISGLSANSVTSTEIAANAVGISELNVSDGTDGQVLTTDGSGTLTFETPTGGAASANAFATNTASGNGSTATFTLSSTPSAESKIIAFINGVFQNQDAYTISGTDITFDTAPIAGTNNVVVYVIGDVYSGESVLISNFNGNGSTTAFTLSNNPGNENNTQVYIDGVYQQKTTYSVSGTTLTFSSAPPTGTANIEVVMLTSTTVNTPAAGSVVTASMADDSVTGAKLVSSAVTTAKIADANVTTAKIADANVTTAKIANDAVTLDKIADAVFVTESEGISSNDNDTTLPTSAAVKDYVDGKDFETGLAGDSGTGTVNTSQTLTVSGTANEVNTSVSGQTVTVGLPDSVSLTSNLTVGGYIAGPASFTIDPAGVGDNTGTVVIAGNLQVDGTQTIINSTSMSVDDLNLTLASGAANATAANGAGLTIDGASATLLYASSGDKFVFNKGLDVTGDGHDLLINSADYELVLLGNRGSTGVNLDKAYLRMKAEGTNTVVIDTAGNSYFNGGNVGIGTSSPSAKLDVASAAGSVGFNYGTSSSPERGNLWYSTDGTGWKFNIGKVQSNSFTSQITIQDNGNVGIGTSSPLAKLDVNVTGDTDAVKITGNSTTDFDFVANPPEFNLQDTSSTSGTKRARITVNSNQFQIHALPDDDTVVSHNLFIANLSNGYVGIGTSSPGYKLEVESSSDADLIQIQSTAGSNDTVLRLGISGDVATLNASGGSTGSLAFKTYGTERMRIDSSGNVGIGINSPGTYTTDDNSLAVLGQVRIEGVTNTAAVPILALRDTNSGLFAPASNEIGISTAAVERIRIDNTGKVGIGTDNPLDHLHINDDSGDARMLLDGHTNFDAELKFAEAGVVKYTVGHEAGTDSFVIGTTNVDTQKRLVINSAGEIGIGTNAPGVALDIKTSTANTNGVVRIQNDMDNNYEALRIHSLGDHDAQISFLAEGSSTYWGGFGIDYSDAGKFKLQTDNLFAGGSTLMTWARDGKVGIGATNPLTILNVRDSGADIASGNAVEGSTMKGIFLENSVNDSSSLGLWYSCPSGNHQAGVAFRRNDHSSSWGTDIRFFTHENSTVDVDNSRERMIVNSEGNLGIGTSSPESRLHISNNAAPANDVTLLTLQNGNGTGDISTPDTFIDFTFKDSNANTTPQVRIGAHAGDGGDANTTILEGKGYLTFHTSNTTGTTAAAPPEQMRLNSNGSLMIGSTTNPPYPHKLYASGNAITNGTAFFEDTDGSCGLANVVLKLSFSNDTDATNASFIYMTDANSVLGSVGAASGTSVNFSSASDERLKENIVDASSQLDVINNIQIREFDWKSNSHHELGLIAQEINTIVPDVVREGGDNVAEHPWSIDYGKLTPYIIKAMQEQQTIIDDLKARLDEAGL